MVDTVLYIGGFELPDRNAAAQRVFGIANALRKLGYNVVFLNALKSCENKQEEKRALENLANEYAKKIMMCKSGIRRN